MRIACSSGSFPLASSWPRSQVSGSARNHGGLESSAKRFGLGAAAAHTATDAIEEGAHERWYYLIFGLVLLQWFAMGVVRAIRLAHAVAWGTGRVRLRHPIQAGIFFTLLATAVIAVSGLAQLLRAEHVAAGIVLTISVVLLYGAIALWMMVLLPHRDAPWRALLPGALVVAVGLQGLDLFGAPVPGTEARPLVGALRLVRRCDGDPALALHRRAADYGVGLPERNALGA